MVDEVSFAIDSPLEGAGFEPSVPRQESRRFEPASVPSRGGRCRRGGYGPGGDRRPDRAVEIADRRWCASEPPLESRIKPSRRVGPSRGTDGSNPSPSSGESANLRSRFRDDAVRATASKMRRCWLPGSALDESQKVGAELLLMGDRQSAGYKSYVFNRRHGPAWPERPAF